VSVLQARPIPLSSAKVWRITGKCDTPDPLKTAKPIIGDLQLKRTRPRKHAIGCYRSTTGIRLIEIGQVRGGQIHRPGTLGSPEVQAEIPPFRLGRDEVGIGYI
jgi:hypothetical protein